MEVWKGRHAQSGYVDPMFGAAIVTDDGREIPITVKQVDDFLEKLVWDEEAEARNHK
ncbi:hypothetical protein M3P05_03015 [Sansalvadorimonas sp. 2012CJ34-2]|uniref:Uncharacterized protein n=1 Tax=Parendozoicomonas callyspongiae TaxID=2942213 RepID=A0ABT0PC09_9GAMM|nr:hypothetical protein [Sansalvadorimonas sp. 2012CJ34-2]MCL6268922.1 hypothetical protein [Sansalvadorimonas sp. 2012CJ34-2]